MSTSETWVSTHTQRLGGKPQAHAGQEVRPEARRWFQALPAATGLHQEKVAFPSTRSPSCSARVCVRVSVCAQVYVGTTPPSLQRSAGHGDQHTASRDLCPLDCSPGKQSDSQNYPPVSLAVPGIHSSNKPDSAAMKMNGLLHHTPRGPSWALGG